MNEPLISFFPHIKAVTGGETYLLRAILDAIRTGGPWKDAVLTYRSMPETTEEEIKAKKKFKKTLPYFTGSGVFEARRADEEITLHNGYIVIDLDHLEDVNHVKSLICADPYVAYAFVSCSGNGVAVGVKIDGTKHLESFKALQAYFKNQYGLTGSADPHCSDVSRSRFVSVDPDAFDNLDNSQLFVVGRDYVSHVKRTTKKMLDEAKKGEVHHTLIKASRLMGGYIAGNIIPEEEGFEHLVEIMRDREGVVDLDEERKKIRDGINNGKLAPVKVSELAVSIGRTDAEKAAFTDLFSFAHTMNREGRKYTEGDVNIMYDKLNAKFNITRKQVEEVFVKVFTENEDEFGINDKPEIIKVEIYLNKYCVFARNVITGTIEYRAKEATAWDRLNVNTVYRHLQHVGFKFSMDKLKSLFNSDFVNEFNPFVDYFAKLPAWDGVDHIAKLASYISVADQEFFNIQLKKMLVRSIGCSLYGIENRFVFVLVGEKQNTGKSSFIRFLSPFGTKHYTEAPIRNDKDASFSFAENFIYNMEELASLNNIEVNRLKAIISTASIKERRAYAANAEEMPRRCNFFGSTNKGEFLVDSENTRWLCFTVDNIDWRYRSEIDITKVWAQAYALWHTKEYEHQLTRDEAEKRDRNNKDYEVTDLEKELIKRVFTVCQPHEGEFMSNADILQAIDKHWEGPKGQLTGRLISKHMVQLGFLRDVRKLHGHTVRGYYVLKTGTFEDYQSKPEIISTTIPDEVTLEGGPVTPKVTSKSKFKY